MLAGSFAFHAYRAEHPTTSYQSADERSYGKLAVGIADEHTYGNGLRDPLHWPPGAPMLFAAGHAVAPDAASAETFDIPSAYWLQALVSLGTALAAFAIAALLAGAWAGVAAAALVGLYPPLILATGEQISEPLGAFWLTLAFLLFVVAARRGQGVAVRGRRPGARRGGAHARRPAAGAVRARPARGAVDLARGRRRGAAASWSAALHPRRRGAGDRALERLRLAARGRARPGHARVGSALFVGTYLPGNGTTVGMKRALGARRPSAATRSCGARADFDLEARSVLAVVADRHPDLEFNRAVALEARRNISRYAREDPVGYAGMMLNKVQRMWSRYARGGARHTSPVIRGWHILLVLLAARRARRRDRARPLAAAGVHPRRRADLDRRPHARRLPGPLQPAADARAARGRGRGLGHVPARTAPRSLRCRTGRIRSFAARMRRIAVGLVSTIALMLLVLPAVSQAADSARRDHVAGAR